MNQPVIVSSLLLALLFTGGCGESSQGIDVEGAITYDGVPVESGLIRFHPTEGQEARYAEFKNGHYEMKGDVAPMPGAYTVHIDGYKKVKDPGVPDYAKDENGMITKSFIPAKYNANSELTVEIREGQSTYDFNLDK